MGELFSRRAAVTVGTLRVTGLRIAFRVTKSAESEANQCEATIWGLSEASRGRIQDELPTSLIIEAGYEDSTSTLFYGEAVRPRSVKTPTGWVTKIAGSDGHTPQREIVNLSMPPDTSVGDAIATIARKMKVGASTALRRALAGDFDGGLSAFANGLTFSGSAKEEMDKLTSSLGVEWSIQDGELLILNEGDTAGEAVLLSPDTGLIGSPETAQDAKNKSLTLVRCRSLLQGIINPGRRLELESEAISGSYQVRKVMHQGDTHGPGWYSDLESREL